MLGSLFTWPFSGLLWVVKELEQAAREDRAAEGDQIREDLRLLYLQIENGEISEDDFAAREGPLLDRLEELEARQEQEAEEGEEEDEDSEELDEELDEGLDEELDEGLDEELDEELDDDDDHNEGNDSDDDRDDEPQLESGLNPQSQHLDSPTPEPTPTSESIPADYNGMPIASTSIDDTAKEPLTGEKT